MRFLLALALGLCVLTGCGRSALAQLPSAPAVNEPKAWDVDREQLTIDGVKSAIYMVRSRLSDHFDPGHDEDTVR